MWGCTNTQPMYLGFICPAIYSHLLIIDRQTDLLTYLPIYVYTYTQSLLEHSIYTLNHNNKHHRHPQCFRITDTKQKKRENRREWEMERWVSEQQRWEGLEMVCFTRSWVDERITFSVFVCLGWVGTTVTGGHTDNTSKRTNSISPSFSLSDIHMHTSAVCVGQVCFTLIQLERKDSSITLSPQS